MASSTPSTPASSTSPAVSRPAAPPRAKRAPFWAYLGGAIIPPRATFGRLLVDPRRLVYGPGATLLVGGLHTLTVAGLAVAAAQRLRRASAPVIGVLNVAIVGLGMFVFIC